MNLVMKFLEYRDQAAFAICRWHQLWRVKKLWNVASQSKLELFQQSTPIFVSYYDFHLCWDARTQARQPDYPG